RNRRFLLRPGRAAGLGPASRSVLQQLLQLLIGARDVAPHHQPHGRFGNAVETARLPAGDLAHQAAFRLDRLKLAGDRERERGTRQRGNSDQPTLPERGDLETCPHLLAEEVSYLLIARADPDRWLAGPAARGHVA